jgi:hypothetical protein
MRIWLIARDGKHQERDHKPGERADGDLEQPVDRGIQRIGVVHRRTSSTITAVTVAALRLGLIAPMNAIGATVSTSSASKSTFPGMRDQDRDGAAIDRAADRAEHIVAGRLQRPANAHLGDNQRCQHRP